MYEVYSSASTRRASTCIYLTPGTSARGYIWSDLFEVYWLSITRCVLSARWEEAGDDLGDGAVAGDVAGGAEAVHGYV